MGKYSKVVKDLVRVTPEPGPFQTAVEVEKATIKDRRPSTLAARYHAIRAEKDEIERQEKELNVKLAATEQLLWKAYEDDGTETIKLGGGVSVGVTDDVSVVVEDREKFNAWARANGLESMMTLYAATVESITKQRLLAGDALPDGVRVGSFTKTTYRRGPASG